MITQNTISSYVTSHMSFLINCLLYIYTAAKPPFHSPSPSTHPLYPRAFTPCTIHDHCGEVPLICHHFQGPKPHYSDRPVYFNGKSEQHGIAHHRTPQAKNRSLELHVSNFGLGCTCCSVLLFILISWRGSPPLIIGSFPGPLIPPSKPSFPTYTPPPLPRLLRHTTSNHPYPFKLLRIAPMTAVLLTIHPIQTTLLSRPNHNPGIKTLSNHKQISTPKPSPPTNSSRERRKAIWCFTL